MNNLVNLIAKFLRYCDSEENLSPNTIRWMKTCSKTFVSRTGITEIGGISLDILRGYFYEGKEKYQWSVSTTLNHMKFLKKFLGWCVQQGYIKKNLMLEIKRPKQPKTLPRFLNREQSKTILCASFTHDWFYEFERHRNYAIIGTLLYTGIRASELLNLSITDVNLSSGNIFIRAGKGQKDRHVPIYHKLKYILESYRRERVRLSKTSIHFFTGAQSNSKLNYKDLSRVCGKLSKVTGVKFTPHALRHTAATELLNQGLDIYKVSKILGHTDIKTTTIYLHTATENLQKSVNELDLY